VRAALASLALLLLFAGCVAPGPGAPVDVPGLALSEPVRVVGLGLAREPAIEQLPDGTLFVAGFPGDFAERPPTGPAPPLPVGTFRALDFLTTPPGLWASRDLGATWEVVDPGTVEEGALGNSDVDLAVGPEGTLHFASMTYTDVGHSIAVGASPDGGASWTWTVLSTQPMVDRPWVAVAPDGVAHAVWNDGAVVHHASSSDRGASWTEHGPAHLRGGTGNLAVAPDGTVAVRIIPPSGSGWTVHRGEDGVAVRGADGAWTFRPLPGNRTYASVPEAILGTAPRGLDRWADPLAFDAAGTLYAAWGEDEAGLLLARSRDLGATWDVVALAPGGGPLAIFPHLRAHPAEPGRLALTWMTRGDDEVLAHVALVEDADGPAPRIHRADAFAMDTGANTGGEYFQAVFLQGGGLGFATTVQTPEETGFEYRTARRP
jgi:hypothetical protein